MVTVTSTTKMTYRSPFYGARKCFMRFNLLTKSQHDNCVARQPTRYVVVVFRLMTNYWCLCIIDHIHILPPRKKEKNTGSG